MTEWQPVETAPDLRPVLIWVDFESDGGCIFIGMRDGGEWCDDDDKPIHSKITHWMPLPKRPFPSAYQDSERG